jgi:hypothetical protein
MTRIATHVVLSMAHITEKVSRELCEMGPDTSQPSRFTDWRRGVIRCEFGYGHWMKVPSPDDTDPEDGLEIRLADIPECLAACMRHAARFGAHWMLLDQDEETIPDLRTYGSGR